MPEQPATPDILPYEIELFAKKVDQILAAKAELLEKDLRYAQLAEAVLKDLVSKYGLTNLIEARAVAEKLVLLVQG